MSFAFRKFALLQIMASTDSHPNRAIHLTYFLLSFLFTFFCVFFMFLFLFVVFFGVDNNKVGKTVAQGKSEKFTFDPYELSLIFHLLWQKIKKYRPFVYCCVGNRRIRQLGYHQSVRGSGPLFVFCSFCFSILFSNTKISVKYHKRFFYEKK